MSSQNIRVLLVDDSATIRSALKIMIRREADMEVVGAAPNGKEALRMVEELRPDVVLMDIEMPVMDGIEATSRIMQTHPTPIIIFSSLAEESAPKTFAALDAGAIDYVTKDLAASNALEIGDKKNALIEKIRQFAAKRSGSRESIAALTMVRNRERFQEWTARVERDPTQRGGDAMLSRAVSAAPTDAPRRSTIAEATSSGSASPTSNTRKTDVPTMRLIKANVPRNPVRLIAVGASTGGPQALQTLVQALPADLAVPVVMVQHMPATFVPSFAQRLNAVCALEVQVAAHGDLLERGHVYVAPGASHMRIAGSLGNLRIDIDARDVPGILHKPSVDVLFDSVADVLDGDALVAVLTGMGRDGALAAKRLHDFGATVLAQDEASSVVYGMPRAVVELGAHDMVMPIEEIGEGIVFVTRRGSR